MIIIAVIIFMHPLSQNQKHSLQMQDLRNYPIYQSYTLTPSTDRFSSIYILSAFDSPTQHEFTRNESQHQQWQDQQTCNKNQQNEESIECDSSVNEPDQSDRRMMVSSIEEMVNEHQRELQKKQKWNKAMNLQSIQYVDQSYLSASQEFSQQFIIQNTPNVKLSSSPHRQNKPVFDRSKDKVFPSNPFSKKDDHYQGQLPTAKEDRFQTQLYRQGQKLRQILIDTKQYNLHLQNIYSFFTQSNNNPNSHTSNVMDKPDFDLLKQLIAHELSNRQP